MRSVPPHLHGPKYGEYTGLRSQANPQVSRHIGFCACKPGKHMVYFSFLLFLLPAVMRTPAVNPLNRLLALSEIEKKESGLLHTPAEIAQQPATWRVTHRLFEEFQSTLQGFLRPAYSEKWTVYLIGAGTSDYIGHAVANLLRRRWQCEVSVIASTDLLTNHEDLVIPGRKYLWISFSRSGESPEGIAVLEQALAQNPNVKHLVVSCNKKGRMVELAQQSKQCLAMLL